MSKTRALENSYLSTFCMELHILMQSGITFGDGFLMMQDDEASKEGKDLLRKLIYSTEKGIPLSAALQEAGCFPRYMISMVEVGETTGRLSETLKALSEYYDKQDRLALSIKNAVLYPAILLVMMMAVVIILIVKVLPMFNDTFEQLGTEMSDMAKTLMRFGGWLENVAAGAAIIVGVIIVVAFIVWMSPVLRKGLTDTIRNILGARGLFGEIASAHFTSAMTLALASGLDSEKAVEMAAAVSGGVKAVDAKNQKCLDALRGGATLSDALRSSEIISARDSRMLSLGSRSGTTDAVIFDIARRADRNVQDGIDHVVSRIEPTLVIITSVIVGVILFSVMMPLMGIMNSIG